MFLRRVILPLAGLIVLLLVGAGIGMTVTSRYQTEVAIGEQVRLAEGALAVHGGQLAKAAADYGNWDDAVVALVDRFDADWAEVNIGQGSETSYGAEFAFVVDDEDRTIYSRIAGVSGATPFSRVLDGAAGDLIARWRRGDPVRAATGLVEASGVPAVMAIAPVRPYNDTERPQQTGYGIIFVDVLDEALLANLARTYLLPGLRIVGPDVAGVDYRASSPIAMHAAGATGAEPRFLAWDPARPGDLLMERAAPVLAMIAIAFLAMTVLVLRHAAEAAQLIRQSEARALHDALTGLPNRILLQDRLERVVTGISKRVHGVAVLFLDLDGFKAVNDRYGHDAGDDLLQQFAARLERCIREIDTVARFGGDEFAVVLPGETDHDRIRALAEAIMADVARPFRLRSGPAEIGVSIGVAIAPGDGTAAAELLRKADVALYRAKAEGKGRVRFFTEPSERPDPAPRHAPV
ncbi:diguanylate cyclase domain-containing protein [Methylobrevis albus]|uniref:Diguanylate cyclase n=1 Tax=Methylobrevis albus TaxID=2793297 RepID=A0A931MWX1_9HYPH|nr:diguanylate cyclase [Methylobrevis albus]MBH0238043.1 diguanylate cyclase [Methylobrevis albus]